MAEARQLQVKHTPPRLALQSCLFHEIRTTARKSVDRSESRLKHHPSLVRRRKERSAKEQFLQSAVGTMFVKKHYKRRAVIFVFAGLFIDKAASLIRFPPRYSELRKGNPHLEALGP